LDKREIRRFIRDWTDRITRGNTQRAKMIAVCCLCGIAVLCLGVSVAPLLHSRPKAREPHSAGWTHVRELNEALVAKDAFADTAFVVESERPLTLKLTGAVRKEQDLKDLLEYVKKLEQENPGNRYEVDVQVMKLEIMK
jgi:hypothetical protein